MADVNEIERIKAARALVAAPIIVTLCDICSELGRKDLARRVKSTLKGDIAAVQNICINDPALNGLVMRMRMSKVPRDYQLETAVPHGFESATRKLFPIFINAARAFWAEWCADNEELFAQIRAFLGCGDTMPIDATETAMFWSRDHPFWVGIMIVYADASGHEYK